MKSLNDLNLILQKLTKQEIKLLINYLSTNSKYKNTNKSLRLINLILTDKESNSIFLQEQIYGYKNYMAFNKLLLRLKEKALEVLLFDASIFDNKYSKRNQVIFELKKRLIQADILQLKGLRQSVLPMYNSIIKKAREFELYDVLIQALYSTQRLISVHGKTKSMKRLNEQIEHNRQCWNLLIQSQNKFTEMTNKISVSSNFNSYSEELDSSIRFLEVNYEFTKSPLINFYLLTLKVEKAQNYLRFDYSKSILLKLLDLVQNSLSVNTPNRRGTVLLNLANNYIYTKEFDKSIDILSISREFFMDQEFTLRITDEILFYSYFYLGDLKKCLELIQNINSAESSDFLFSKFEYFKASIYFLLHNFEYSIHHLNNISDITRDKEGWNVNYRILTLLCLIENKDYETVDIQIQTLQQFIKRISKSKVIRLRYIIILRILLKLVNVGYDYDKVYSLKRKYFDLLNSDDVNYNWQIKSPELIDFSNWFTSHLRHSR